VILLVEPLVYQLKKEYRAQGTPEITQVKADNAEDGEDTSTESNM